MFKPIFSFIVIIISTVFAFLYAIPEYSRVQERRGDLAKLVEISKNAGEIETLISQTEETLKSVDLTRAARFAVFLPETPDPIRLANNLQRLGLTNGIVLQNIKVEEPVINTQKSVRSNGGGVLQTAIGIFNSGGNTGQGEGNTEGGGTNIVSEDKKYATIKASFTFTATHEAFSKFLFDTEKSLGLINITALSFVPVPVAQVAVDTKKVKQEAPLLYQYAIAVETYSLD